MEDFSAIASAIRWHYGITPAAIRPVSRRSVGHPKRVMEVVAHNSLYYVSVVGECMSEESVERSLAYQESLRSKGIRCPEVVLTRHDDMLIKLNGGTLYMCKGVSGRTLSRGDISRAQWSTADSEAAKMVLASLRSANPPERCCGWRYFEDIVSTCTKIRSLGACSALALSTVDRVLAVLEEIRDLRPTPRDTVFVHSDLHHRNVLFKGDSDVTLIDFDLCAYEDPWYPLAMLVLAYPLEPYEPLPATLEPTRLTDMLKGGVELELRGGVLGALSCIKYVMCMIATWTARDAILRNCADSYCRLANVAQFFESLIDVCAFVRSDGHLGLV